MAIRHSLFESWSKSVALLMGYKKCPVIANAERQIPGQFMCDAEPPGICHKQEITTNYRSFKVENV